VNSPHSVNGMAKLMKYGLAVSVVLFVVVYVASPLSIRKIHVPADPEATRMVREHLINKLGADPASIDFMGRQGNCGLVRYGLASSAFIPFIVSPSRGVVIRPLGIDQTFDKSWEQSPCGSSPGGHMFPFVRL